MNNYCQSCLGPIDPDTDSADTYNVIGMCEECMTSSDWDMYYAKVSMGALADSGVIETTERHPMCAFAFDYLEDFGVEELRKIHDAMSDCAAAGNHPHPDS